jgi:hypothetical protein
MSIGTQREWTQIEIDFVLREYKHNPTPVVAAAIGRTPAAVVYMAQRWGLRKSAKGRTAGMKFAWENRRAA